MKIHGIRWLGIPTTRYAETVDFLQNVLHLELRQADDDFTIFVTENGDAVEVFGPKAIADGHDFMIAPVAGFQVDDVAVARADLESQGVAFIGPVHTGGSSTWSHFRGPDDHVYELTSRR